MKVDIYRLSLHWTIFNCISMISSHEIYIVRFYRTKKTLHKADNYIILISGMVFPISLQISATIPELQITLLVMYSEVPI